MHVYIYILYVQKSVHIALALAVFVKILSYHLQNILFNTALILNHSPLTFEYRQ